jgi:hypothetical protein
LNSTKVEGLVGARADLNNVEMITARIGQLALQNANIRGQLSAFGIEVSQHVFLSGASFAKIDLRSTKIKGLADLGGATFSEDVDLSEAEIDGSLKLDSESGAAKWLGSATLILRGARIGAISRLSDGWPRKLDIDRFTYRGVETLDSISKDWLRKTATFSKQPYEQLAVVLQSQGNADDATAIRFAGRDREREESTGWRWLWLTTLDYLIGYGYYPARAIGWALGLLVLGVCVFWISGQGRSNGMPYGLAYSFDLLLPIIKLREMHYEIDLQGWPRYYFYAHKIAGYLLASFLIAGLSGLTK